MKINRRVLFFVFALVLATAYDAFAQPAVRTGFTVVGTQVREDDIFTGPIAIGFPINFFGTTLTNVYVGTNGYITFEQGQTGYVPENLVNNAQKIIAAFYADIDTRSTLSGQISWGRGTVNGRQAFAVTWNAVGYYDVKADKRNTFQIVLINRGDRAVNDFDFEFNYNQIQWEAGEANNSNNNGLCGLQCQPPSVGYSNGLTGANNRSFEYPGSHVSGAFLDSNMQRGLRYQQFGNSGVAGRLLFTVSNGQVVPLTITNLAPSTVAAGSGNTSLSITGTAFAPGASVRWTFNNQTTVLANPQINGTTQIVVTIPAAQLVNPGTAQIVVANPTGTPSAPRDFVIGPGAGAVISSVAPNMVPMLSPATTIAVNGSNFTQAATVRWTFNGQNTNLSNVQWVSATRLNATIPANLLAMPGSAQIAVVQNGVASGAVAFTIAIPPPVVNLSVTGGDNQATTALSLGTASATAINGTLSLSFAPAVPNLPANFAFQEVRFPNGTTSLNFTIPSGATAAVIPNAGQFSRGTVAGTITVALTALTANGVSVLPNPRPAATLTVARSAPVITPGSVRILDLTSSGFTLEVQGYSSTRELTNFGVTFISGTGATLDGTTRFDVTLANAQSIWFDTTGGRANGSRFSLRLPFVLNGSTTAIGSASVILTNSMGASSAVSGGV